MPDMEKVVTWLEICGKNDDCSAICPYRLGRPTCMRKLMADAFELLKEQQKLIDDITQRRMSDGAFD